MRTPDQFGPEAATELVIRNLADDGGTGANDADREAAGGAPEFVSENREVLKAVRRVSEPSEERDRDRLASAR